LLPDPSTYSDMYRLAVDELAVEERLVVLDDEPESDWLVAWEDDAEIRLPVAGSSSEQPDPITAKTHKQTANHRVIRDISINECLPRVPEPCSKRV